MGNNARVHVGRKQVIISPAIAEEGREREKERETKKKSYNPLSFFSMLLGFELRSSHLLGRLSAI
jgi:hypothetical protein